MSPANGVDAVPTVPINLTAPTEIPDVAPLPFTGVKSVVFTSATPEKLLTLDVTPSQGVVGTPMVISGKGLPPSTTLTLTWSTANATWVVDVQPNTVDYRGEKYVKFNVDLATITTDATGSFSFSTKMPSDFGGVHDIYAIQDGIALAHGGLQMGRTMTISPTKGPVGTPITVTYNGMGANLYTAGAALYWDNNYAGDLQALWTRGTAKVVIRASGKTGEHFIEVKNAFNAAYLNVMQSPLPFTNGGIAKFQVIPDKKGSKVLVPTITWPSKVTPTVTQRTMLTNAGLDPNTKAVATLSLAEGPILTKTTLNVTGMTTTGTHQIVWATVVGNRVNCLSTCWVYNAVPMGSAEVANGSISKEITIPDNLGGWHVIQVKSGDVVEAQVSFYVKQSIMPFYDKAGKVIGMGIAKADNSGTIEAFNLGGAAATPSTTFKNGEEFTISLKGVGWTQLDNTLSVTYDNSFVGYGCGFNSNGYVVIHLKAIGEPGVHIIDLHPALYTASPSYANTVYGMVPQLTSDRDNAGLAVGYQIPAYHFAITITK